MADDWYGDGWDDGSGNNDSWDNGSWDDGSRNPRRSGGLGWIVIGGLALAALIVIGYFILNQLNNAPDKIARAWLEAVTSMDDQKAASLTCTNVTTAGQNGSDIGSMVVSFLQDRESVIQDLGIPIDISGLSEYLDFDTRQLTFTVIYEEENYAEVHVGGPLSIRFQVLSVPLQLDENWRMIREDGRWKWCGR